MRIFPTFMHARETLRDQLLNSSYLVHAPRWQGVDVSAKPEMAMREVMGWSFSVPLRGNESLDHWRLDIKPNLPWADSHFGERVSGHPLNPGEQWAQWPWGHSADKFRDLNGQFDHTYMERIWPKYAGQTLDGKLPPDRQPKPNRGVRFQLGDLDDLIDHLAQDPLSRQAYLPIWFPEDGTCKGRKPCTLGYHFLMRHDFFHHTYYIRSCDFVRHYSDDVYLALRLHMRILDELRSRDPRWKAVKLGMFTMHIVSLHCFLNDMRGLQDERLVDSIRPTQARSEAEATS